MKYGRNIHNMLVLAEFFKKKVSSEDKHNFLLIEPLILNILDYEALKTQDNILDALSSFKPSKNTIYNLLEKYTDDRIIIREHQSYRLVESEEVKKKISMYDKIKEEKVAEWSTFKNHALRIISKSAHTEIDEFTINEYFFKFYIDILYADIIDDNGCDDNVKRAIGLFLEECQRNKKNQCFSLMEDLLQGLFIAKAVLDGATNLDTDKLPIIYLDNIFMGNLFGWTDNICHCSCTMIFQQLQLSGFKLKIHYETFNSIKESIWKYKNAITQKKDIYAYSYFHYMKHIEPNNSVFNVNNFPSADIHNTLIDELKKYDITVNKRKLEIDINESDDKYHEIDSMRKNINHTYHADKYQTEYTYLMIKHYEIITNFDDNTLNNMKEIFLTCQQAIIKLAYGKLVDATYTPIMSVRKFSKLLLLENSIANSNNNSKLLQAIIKDSYSKYLSNGIIDFVTKVIASTEISDFDKRRMIAFSIDTKNWETILSTDDMNEILIDLNSKDAQIEQLEETSKKITKERDEKDEEHARELQKTKEAAKKSDETHARILQESHNEKDRHYARILKDKDAEHTRILEKTIKERDKERKSKKIIQCIVLIVFLAGVMGIGLYFCIKHKIWSTTIGGAVVAGLLILAISGFFVFTCTKLISLIKEIRE